MLIFLNNVVASPVALFAGVSALFAGLSVIINMLVWCNNKRLVRNAEKVADRQLRAYVSIKNIELNKISMSKVGLVDNWKVSIILENGGNTPARNLCVQTNCEWFTNPIEENFDFPDMPGRKPARFGLGPKGVFYAPSIDIPEPVIESMLNGKKFIYIWGWVDYDDVIFGNDRHRTEFCVQVMREGNVWSFQPYQNFNGFDEGCYRKPSRYIS